MRELATIKVSSIKGLFGAAELNGDRNRFFWELDGTKMIKRQYLPHTTSRMVRTYPIAEFIKEAKRRGIHDIGEPEIGGEAHWYVTFTDGTHKYVDGTAEAKQFINSISV